MNNNITTYESMSFTVSVDYVAQSYFTYLLAKEDVTD